MNPFFNALLELFKKKWKHSDKLYKFLDRKDSFLCRKRAVGGNNFKFENPMVGSPESRNVHMEISFSRTALRKTIKLVMNPKVLTLGIFRKKKCALGF